MRLCAGGHHFIVFVVRHVIEEVVLSTKLLDHARITVNTLESLIWGDEYTNKLVRSTYKPRLIELWRVTH